MVTLADICYGMTIENVVLIIKICKTYLSYHKYGVYKYMPLYLWSYLQSTYHVRFIGGS